MNVSEILDRWYFENKRDLPWRRTESAYHIWLSEVILQQTRVNQGMNYYLRFVERYPAIEDLAKAPVDEVLKLWQGLGYYTRARNLHTTAKTIANEYGGKFPMHYHDLLKLKGIGKYTAAAIASIAFKEPVALVDGNVSRVLSRFYGLHAPIDTSEGKAVLEDTAQKILDREHPGIHNQALMEFGALVCLPRNPHCNECVLANDCVARAKDIVELLPVKEGKSRNRLRYFNYLFIVHHGKTYLHKRGSRDIWNSLYEFPLIETDAPVDFRTLTKTPDWQKIFKGINIKCDGNMKTYKHKLTHQTLYCNFYRVVVKGTTDLSKDCYIPVMLNCIHEYAVPRIIDRFLEDLKGVGML
jgi:A/G-specific adenine glycosylase